MRFKICLVCNKEFSIFPCEEKIAKYCSNSCKAKNTVAGWNKGKKMTEDFRKKVSLGHKGQIPWNKGGKYPQFSEENSYHWKGDKAGYSALHVWVKKWKHQQKLCGHCREEKKLELANVSRTYKRDLNDYIWLCRSCHHKYDGKVPPAQKGIPRSYETRLKMSISHLKNGKYLSQKLWLGA